MRKATHRGQDFFVYRHADLGLVVYDPSFQSMTSTSHVRLYLASKHMLIETRVERARVEVSREGEGGDEEGWSWTDALFAVSNYLGVPADRIEYDTSVYKLKAPRSARCFSCTAKVDSGTEGECEACRWLVCGACRACGCSYNPATASQTEQEVDDRDHKDFLVKYMEAFDDLPADARPHSRCDVALWLHDDEDELPF